MHLLVKFSLWGFGLLIALPLLARWMGGEPKEIDYKRLEREAEIHRKKQEFCRSDASCWGTKHLSQVKAPCRMGIERHASIAYKWVDSPWDGTQLFDTVSWIDKEKGIVLYMGNQVRFQNAFGVWIPMRYSCGYDTSTHKVLAVDVYPR